MNQVENNAVIGRPDDIVDPTRPMDLIRPWGVLPILSPNQHSRTERDIPSELERARDMVRRLTESIFFPVREYRHFRQGGQSCMGMIREPHRHMLADAILSSQLLDLDGQPDHIRNNVRMAILHADDGMDLALVLTPYLRPASEIERNIGQVINRISGRVAMCYDDCRNCRK